jgi:hypothetical protein
MTTLADCLLPAALWQRIQPLLPAALWQRIQPLLPPPPSHASDGAPRTASDRACMAAVIFMARTSTSARLKSASRSS